MRLTLDKNNELTITTSLIEDFFGVKPRTMKKIIQRNPDVFEQYYDIFGANIYNLILSLVRPWSHPDGSGPAMFEYDKCVPRSYRMQWVKENKPNGMYQSDMLDDYYEIKKKNKRSNPVC